MKKNSLTSAIIAGVAGVAGLAGVANAVHLNPDGIGQVLLYPYYTVNADNATLISVVNTADVAKAVKVRFLEGLNSAEVLDFNLYLSAHDVWTGEIKLEGGKPGLLTNDNSCISPRSLTGVFEQFRNYEFTYWSPDKLGVSSSPLNATRMLQGHVEILEMGDLDGYPAAAATHKADGVPLNCAYLRNEWNSSNAGTWLSEAGANGTGNHNVNPPGSGYIDEDGEVAFNEFGGPGGIFGGGVIVNVPAGTSFSYNAYAINGFYTMDANLHYRPGTIFPHLGMAQNEPGYAIATVFDAAGNPFDLGFESGSTADAPSAVSAVLSARYVANEYVSIPGFASSDWVVTFPTKRLHTYRKPANSTTAAGLAPFSVAQGAGSAGDREDNIFMGSWPEEITVQYWDREEGTPVEPVQPGDVSPLPPPGEPTVLAFRQEANVFAFVPPSEFEEDMASPVLGTPQELGASILPLEDGFVAGWARIGFTNTLTSDPDLGDGAYTITGLPIIGFWAVNFVGTDVVGGVVANYTFAHPHRVVRDIRVD